MYTHLSEKELKALVTGLIGGYRVYGTVKKDGFPAFGRLLNANELVLSQTPTHLSAKEFLFPQRETLLRFNIRENRLEEVVEAPDQAIIGLHPCDLNAIALMDKVFAHGTPDANYLERRKRTVLIGADCMPDEYCFCESMGTMEAKGGFDIFLHSIKNGYLARTGTEKGAELLTRFAKTRSAKPAEIKELEGKKRRFKARIEARPEELSGIYEASDESPVWDRIGSICYGCGSCNNVCPTCYCFDIKDEVKANLTEGERVRVWDGCTLTDFAKVAGGHDFRKTRAARLRHRFNRKFRYLTPTFGSLFCVGCGRCSRSCLAKINIVEVTNEIIRERNGRER